jgi:hypothetical protein
VQVIRVRWLSVAAILLVGLLCGLAFAHVLEHGAKMQYDGPLYVHLQRTLYVDWGPPNVGGFLEPAAILVTGLLTFMVRRDRAAAGLAGLALLLLLAAFPVTFFVYVAPANAWFAAADVAALDPAWTSARSEWEAGHALRFAFQLSAEVLLLVGLALPGGVAARTVH